MSSDVVGLILAGGEGRRMGYLNKGLITLGETPLIAHVIERLSPQVETIYISANEDLKQYAQWGYDVIEDDPRWRGKGPLAGIASILSRLDDDTILQVVSCDGPLIPRDLVEKLANVRRDALNPVRIVYPKTPIQAHYLYLQGQVRDLKLIYSLLEADDLRIRALLNTLSAKAVEFSDEGAFINCNSPQDIVRLEEDVYEKL